MALQPSTTVTIRGKGPDMDKYPAKAHAQRVADKLKLNNGMIMIQGAENQFYPDTDMPVPFRQSRAFYYLTGCNEPGCFATYETAKDKLTLWLPKVAEGRRVFYDGRNLNAKEAMEKYDVDEVNVIKGPGPKRTNLRKAFVDHYEAGGEFAFFKLPQHLMGKPLKQKMISRRKTGLRPAIKQCRLIKDEHEIALIRKANHVTAKGHRQIMNRLHALKNEPEALAVFMRTCLANKAQEQAYAPICGAGPMAGQLHYVDNDKNFGKKQLLLVDAGAEWQNYASDVTRTMPINKEKPGHWASEEAEAVYDAVEKIQEACIKQLAPGKKFIDVAWLAVHMAIDALLNIGILKGDHMEIFHAGTVLAFFPHGLGHHMGLDVHDGLPPPADDEKKGKKGKEDDAKKDGKKGEKKVSPKQGAQKGKGNGKNKENWTVVKKEVLFDTEKDMSETDVEKEPLLDTSNDEKAGPAKKNGKNNKVGEKKQDPSKVMSKDKRFERIQGIYKASVANNEAWKPLKATQNPMHYSLNPAFCQGPNTPQAPALKAGMVITVEPGLYFNRWILNRQYLNNEKHAKFIDQEVLKKFFPVGGVRIEDDILITKDGYENLTTAPKGEEMLKIIRNGAKGSKGAE